MQSFLNHYADLRVKISIFIFDKSNRKASPVNVKISMFQYRLFSPISAALSLYSLVHPYGYSLAIQLDTTVRNAPSPNSRCFFHPVQSSRLIENRRINLFLRFNNGLTLINMLLSRIFVTSGHRHESTEAVVDAM